MSAYVSGNFLTFIWEVKPGNCPVSSRQKSWVNLTFPLDSTKPKDQRLAGKEFILAPNDNKLVFLLFLDINTSTNKTSGTYNIFIEHCKIIL